MSRLPMPSPPTVESTSCGSLLQELQDLWNEIGESELEKDRMILQLEQECLDVYRRKVERSRKHKADLHQILADGEAEVSNLVSSLGEREAFVQLEKPNGTLKEQVAMMRPFLDGLRQKKEERVNEFLDVQNQIVGISAEISGNVHQGKFTSQVDERDLTLKRLGEFRFQLHELQKDKNLRLQKISAYVKSIHDLSTVLSIDFNKTISEIHPTFGDSTNSQSKSISNETLARLAGTIHSLNQETKQRLKKLQDLGSTLLELWNLMDTPIEEQRRFDHVTSLISSSADAELAPESLALDVIEKAEHEVARLNIVKTSKMRELVLKKQIELEEIYRSVHMDVDGGAREMILTLIDSGKGDLSELLSSMDAKIVKAKEQAISRKDILDKVEKWTFASEEESWLDDYERDDNRYSAGRGVHKNLKRAEKARVLVNKIPSLVENLISKTKAWEKEKGMPFMYDKVRLLDTLDEYIKLRQQREEDKRRSREQRKQQEQFVVEQEALYGAKPSPLRQLPSKKPLGQSSNANMAGGTPNNRRVSTPFDRRNGMLSSGKERKENGRGNAIIPVNYVALSKDD